MDMSVKIVLIAEGIEEMAATCTRLAEKFGSIEGRLTVEFAESKLGSLPISNVHDEIEVITIPFKSEELASGELPKPESTATLFGTAPVTVVRTGPPGPTVGVDPAAVAPTNAEVDKFGTVWDPKLHAKNKGKNVDGAWRACRKTKGTVAPTNAQGGATMDEVDAVLAVLVGHKVPAAEINGPVSQTVFTDMSKLTGGMEKIREANDPQLNMKALSALKAIALSKGINL